MNTSKSLSKSPISRRLSELQKSVEDAGSELGISVSAIDHWKRASLGLSRSNGEMFNPPNGNNLMRLEIFLQLPDARVLFPYHWPHLHVHGKD